MVTEPTYQPQYRRIERVMRERIAALGPGQRLPSDAELVAEFGVSRMTARNAMAMLADEGLVDRQPGRGSFVAVPPAHRTTNRLLSFTQEMRMRGQVPSSTLLDRDIRPAGTSESTALGLPPFTPIVFLRRLRLADGQPIALETSALIAACADAVMTAELEHGSLHEVLTRAGFALRRGEGTITAAAATSEDARRLGIGTHAPLLVERRVIDDGQGLRIEATESRYPADRYALDVRFEVEASSA